MLSRAQRLRGGLLGLLVGDALGVPYEFHRPHEIPPSDEIEMRDTDTTACVAGGIAGLRWGLDAIPIRWLAQLRGGELLDDLVDGLAPEPNRAAAGYRRLRLQFARWFGKY